ncbi:MAG: sulfide-dependent adenosine diphosphate thiazole synthase [Dehalococcoidia bacterium]|nr:sulfide-dependent adenosine diphosphate thiazole synthase [Dehalococcoidia bacterium]
MDEVTISRAITETFMKEFMDAMDVDVAVVGAGPSGLLAAHTLAKSGLKTAVFERQLRVGGGMPGGGMMFNRIVLQKEGKDILDEFGVRTVLYKRGYYTADALEAIASICVGAIRAGAKIFNLMTVEDIMIRGDKRVSGLVLQWTAVNMAKMHVDPLTVRAKAVIDATGHESDVCRILVRKTGPKLRTATGDIMGEKSMWAERGEADLVKNTIEVYPGLIVAGMAANAVLGSPRMGAVFGGMLISGRKAGELARSIIEKG